MKTFDKILEEAKKVKIPFKATNAFKTGLEHGAEDMLVGRDDWKESFKKTSFYKNFEEAAYKTGWDIGHDKKVAKMNKSERLRYAFESGKFDPVGWNIYQDSMEFVTIEEL